LRLVLTREMRFEAVLGAGCKPDTE
jgi:hypothetical protein